MSTNELYQQLADAVVNMDFEQVRRAAQRALDTGLPPEEAIEKGLAQGMNRVGQLFAAKEYFVPEVLVCSKVMYAGFDILKSQVEVGRIAQKGTITIGVVDGDFHDIGKNIVKLMLEAAGFRLVDLTKNVPLEKFKASIQRDKPDIIALSTLMTTTMDTMAEFVATLQQSNPALKFMVGGAPLSADFAKEIGAHFYGKDAHEAVIGAHQLLDLPYEG
ncbi:MAG: B12-binding domain-containing protein [bacterium]